MTRTRALGFVPGIEDMTPTMQSFLPETGLKLSLASGTLAVKKVGVRGKAEPVWPGRPVNFATKCADHAGANQIVVTESVFNAFKDNDYVTHSCGCHSGTPRELWSLFFGRFLSEGEGIRQERGPERGCPGLAEGIGAPRRPRLRRRTS